MIEEYLKLVKGFIHEANEPEAVFKHQGTYCGMTNGITTLSLWSTPRQ